jgi:hypothetical protein
MIQIHVEEDCGNAPKKVQIRDFTIALAQHQPDRLLEELAENVRWNQVGNSVLEGKDAVAQAISAMPQTKASELTIKTVMTHGNVGAADGVVTTQDGATYAFCDVYRFSSNAKNAKIKEITSYLIKL